MKYSYAPAVLSLAAILFGSSFLALILYTIFMEWNALVFLVLGLVLFLSNMGFLFVMRAHKSSSLWSSYLLNKLKIVSFMLLLCGEGLLFAAGALYW